MLFLTPNQQCQTTDRPSTPSDNLWKLIYLATEALSDSFEHIGAVEITLSIYLIYKSPQMPIIGSLRGGSKLNLIHKGTAVTWPLANIIIIIIIKDIYIMQVRKGHKCAMSAEMAVWSRNCLCLYSYLHN